MKKSRFIGPSMLITAAFIGPGTVTVCSLAGIRHGYSLLWVILFAVLAAVLFQEMAARLGVLSGKGLSFHIFRLVKWPWLRSILAVLIFTAIILGNTAYQAGNISGAVLGLESLLDFPGSSWGVEARYLLPFSIGTLALVILWLQSFRYLQFFLIALVLLMSVVFVITAIAVFPPLPDLFAGIGWDLPLTDILALLGTIIVPYNLFLHASTISSKWNGVGDIAGMRWENAIAIGVGGLISAAIIVTAASVNQSFVQQQNPFSLISDQLSPILGEWSGVFIGFGLLAAGLSSSITAPLAAGLVAKEIMPFAREGKMARYPIIPSLVVIVGAGFAMLGYKPLQLIELAQVANSFLLPLVGLFLIMLVNQKYLGTFRNRPFRNLITGLCYLLILALAVAGILRILG